MKKKMVKKAHGILGLDQMPGGTGSSVSSPTAVTRNMAATSPSPALGTFGSRPVASSGNSIGSGNVNQAGSMVSSPNRVQLGGRLDTGTGSVSSLSRNQNRDAAMGLLKDTAPARPAGQAPARTSRRTGVAGALNNSVQGQANIRAKTGLNLRAGTDMSGVMGSLPRMPEMGTRVNQSTAGSSAANRRMGTSGFAGTSKKAHGFDAGGGFGNPYDEMASAKKQPSSRAGVRNVGLSPATATGPQARPVSSGGPGAALSPMTPAARAPGVSARRNAAGEHINRDGSLTAGQVARNAARDARRGPATSRPRVAPVLGPYGPYNAPASRPVAATPANIDTRFDPRVLSGFAGYGNTSHGYGRSNVKLMDDEDC